jgi:N-acetylglucosaminyldiphosphoundecaprenol N-acetyl-beta-D-mannosaminyltransferase
MLPTKSNDNASQINRDFSPVPCPLSPLTCTIAGIKVHNLSEEETLGKIGELIARGDSHYMAVVNAAKLVNARSDTELREILNRAAVVTADGMSVVWAARFLGQPLKARVTGIDLFERLIQYAEVGNLRVYFLGARDDVIARMMECFKARFPALRIAGFHNGYFNALENLEIVEEIKRAKTDLLFVAMGSPAQEKWIAANLKQSGAKFALGVGGSFDHLAGFVRRAPLWMQRAGLEWLHRFLLEPHRLWRRYLIGNTRFIWLILKQKLAQGGRADERQKAKGKRQK